jgi:hypothetical protein
VFAVDIVGSVFPEQNVNSELHEAFLREKLIPFCNERFVVPMNCPFDKILLGHTIVMLLSIFRTTIFTINKIRTAALVHLDYGGLGHHAVWIMVVLAIMLS